MTTTSAARGDLVAAVRRTLASGGDPVRAAGQQRYLRSEMPLRGFRLPELRAALRPVLDAHPVDDAGAWEATIRALWDEAGYREERHAAIALARHRPYRAWATDPATLPLYRHLVLTGAWWDLVDDVATHLLAPLLLAHPEVAAEVRAWAVDDDVWVRRAAILAQIGARGRTDTSLLTDCVEVNLLGSPHGREFFVRKAIGWALRDLARTDAAWVAAYVEALGDRLSPLSRREALKHLG
ncbi:3-methyladenine DNA glycosylase AlkD [Georgenia soli]|uniref:3-methyladenine DNA glycosylase AlkD n=1 Tax=Georgenia soli TaxID=638953 RepID=A0A2A9EQ01_9MICO|nr:DNA alkylation repair protein [Georgenia soli]PFG40988.1 3-methyladenine DNA glycosylase AlkD [Georgenia soli]